MAPAPLAHTWNIWRTFLRGRLTFSLCSSCWISSMFSSPSPFLSASWKVCFTQLPACQGQPQASPHQRGGRAAQERIPSALTTAQSNASKHNWFMATVPSSAHSPSPSALPFVMLSPLWERALKFSNIAGLTLGSSSTHPFILPELPNQHLSPSLHKHPSAPPEEYICPSCCGTGRAAHRMQNAVAGGGTGPFCVQAPSCHSG